MLSRTPALATILAAAALASGVVPAATSAASAARPADPGRSEYAPQETTPPVLTGPIDGGGNGRKN